MSFTRRVEIAADNPLFAGHFPGLPIFPGIAHPLLALGREARIAEIASLKLRSPVRPGDLLDVAGSGPAEDGSVRFELRRGGELVSQGALRTAPPEWSGVPVVPVAMEQPGGYPPVAALLPHAPPARLVREILDASAEAAAGLVEIPADSPFVLNGQAPAFLGLEAAAQCAAALEALSRREDSGPRIGYLVGARNVRCHTLTLPAEQVFRATVRLSGSAAALSIYEVALTGADGAVLVEGTISTYLTA